MIIAGTGITPRIIFVKQELTAGAFLDTDDNRWLFDEDEYNRQIVYLDDTNIHDNLVVTKIHRNSEEDIIAIETEAEL